MGRLTNRTFDEIADEVFLRAMNLKYPTRAIKEARALAKKLKDENGNRIAKCVASLFYVCNKHGIERSKFRMQYEFGITTTTIAKYERIIKSLLQEQDSKTASKAG